MSLKFGDVDISQIVENEYRIGVLEGFVEWILTNNNAFMKDLTSDEMDKIRQRVLERLQQKYPGSGIERRRE